MTVLIRMQGELDATEVDGGGDDVVSALNSAMNRGLHFLAMEKSSGGFVAFQIQNITKIEEDED